MEPAKRKPNHVIITDNSISIDDADLNLVTAFSAEMCAHHYNEPARQYMITIQFKAELEIKENGSDIKNK